MDDSAAWWFRGERDSTTIFSTVHGTRAPVIGLLDMCIVV